MQSQPSKSSFSHRLAFSQLPVDLLNVYHFCTTQPALDMSADNCIDIIGAVNTDILNAQQQNKSSVWQIGIDEAGRGPLLGSVVVSAVLLPDNLSGFFEQISLTNSPLAMINDSKKLTEKKRDTLYEIIPDEAMAYVTVSIPAQVIDVINILQASLLGMRLAGDYLIANVVKNSQLPQVNETPKVHFLYDGNKLPTINNTFYDHLGMDTNGIKHEAIVKGDAKHSAIAAASVLAKVTRDAQMYELAKKYPHYGIEKHKGYPTKAHFERLASQGVLAEHRMSFAPVKNAHKLY